MLGRYLRRYNTSEEERERVGVCVEVSVFERDRQIGGVLGRYERRKKRVFLCVEVSVFKR